MRSELVRSHGTRVIRGGVRFLALLLLLLASCGKLLGLRDGDVQGSCTSDDECAPGYGCLQSLGCRNRCTADSECGKGSRCFKAFITTACIPASEGCGKADLDSGALDGCPEGTRCDGTVCRTQCVTADQCAGGQVCVSVGCVGSDLIHETPLGGGSGGTFGENAGAGSVAGKHAGGASNGGTSNGGTSNGGTSNGGSGNGGASNGGSGNGGASNGGSGNGGASNGGAGKGGSGNGGSGNGGAGNGGAGKGGAPAGGAPAGGAPAGGAPAGGAPAGGAPAVDGPCDIYGAASTPCVAAYSMVRALSRSYNGPLYQVRSGSSAQNTGTGGTLTNIGKTADGFANVAAQNAACGATICTVSMLYDQSGNGNHLKVAPKGNPAGGANAGMDDYESSATNGVVSVGGRQLHSLYTVAQEGYRLTAKGQGMPLGDTPQGIYMLADGTRAGTLCCWDFGNVTTNPLDFGTSNTLFFGVAFWGKGAGAGPWFMGDFEGGVWAGGSLKGDPGWGGLNEAHPANLNNPSLKVPFALGMLKTSSGKYAIRVADLQQATSMTTAYDGNSPKSWANQGGIVLGVAADNGNASFGTFYEGAILAGRPPDATDAAVLRNIQAVGYGK